MQQGSLATEIIIKEREDLFIKRLGEKLNTKAHIEIAELIELQRIYEIRPSAIPAEFMEKCKSY